MATVFMIPVGPLYQALTDTGAIGNGYKLYTYVGGTVSTPQTTYTDSTGTVANSNPIILGSNGRFQSVNVWVTTGVTLKLVLTDSTGAVITGGTMDNVPAINNGNATGVNYTSTGSSTTRSVSTKLGEFVSVKDYGAIGNGSTDDTAAIQAALAASKRLYFPAGTYLCGSAIFDNVPVTQGLYWYGEKRGGLDQIDGTVIKYTGSGICFKFQQAIGSSDNGAMVFENFTFQATGSTAGMFQFNDPALTPVPTDTGTTAAFIREIRFNGCAFWGAGSATQGDAIKGVKLFELVTDENCYFRGWRRGIWLYGCDNNTINGRFSGNGRHLQLEGAGTFGNDNLVTARWFGYTYNGGEAQYCIYDSANHTTMIGNDLEPLAGATAAMYLEGNYCQYYSIDFQFPNTVPPFSMGAGARALVFTNTNAKSSVGTPIVAAATTLDSPSLLGDFSGVTFVNPSAALMTALLGVTRVMIQGGQARTTGQMENTGKEVATANGIASKRFVINASNYNGRSSSAGFTEPLLVVDSASYVGTAIKIKSTNLNGFLVDFTVGNAINNADTIKLTVIGKASAAPGSGTFRYTIAKNLVSVANGALSTATTYTANTATYTLAGFAAGDSFSVGVYNAAVTDGTTYSVSAIILELVNVAIPDTSGVTLANLEIEVNKIKAVMRLFGLIGG
jgi:Pectate lyase superfamily protein